MDIYMVPRGAQHQYMAFTNTVRWIKSPNKFKPRACIDAAVDGRVAKSDFAPWRKEMVRYTLACFLAAR